MEPSAGRVSEPPLTLGIRDQLALSVFWFSLNFQSSALLPIVVPAQLLVLVTASEPGGARQALALALLGTAGGVVAIAVQPLAGAVSDRSRSRHGRRRPYLVLGTLVAVAGLAAMAQVASLALFVAGFVLMQVGTNAATAAFQALLPDRVPREQRGEASGFLGLMTMLGSVGSLAVAGLVLGSVSAGPAMAAAVERGAFVFYAASVAVLLVGVALTWRGLRESSGAGSAIAAGDLRRYATDWLRPLRSPRFFWVFNARVLVILGLNLFLTFIEYYFARVAHVRDFVAATAGVALLALAGALASAVLVGRLSDHISRVPLVAWATLLMAVAAATFVVVPNAAPLPVLGIVFGLGYGAYTSVDWALAVDSLPSAGAAGRDMGVWNIASTLPSVAAPLLGGLLIAAVASSGEVELGYRGVFGLAALCFVLGALALRRVATFA